MKDEQWARIDLIPEDTGAHLEEAKAVDTNKFALKYKRNVSYVSLFRLTTSSGGITGQG